MMDVVGPGFSPAAAAVEGGSTAAEAPYPPVQGEEIA